MRRAQKLTFTVTELELVALKRVAQATDTSLANFVRTLVLADSEVRAAVQRVRTDHNKNQLELWPT